jgi:hypothetical protein
MTSLEACCHAKDRLTIPATTPKEAMHIAAGAAWPQNERMTSSEVWGTEPKTHGRAHPVENDVLD